MAVKEVLNQAKQQGFSLGAFNAGNLELVKAVFRAGENLSSPLILETSAGEAIRFGMGNFLNSAEGLCQETGLRVSTNFDHGPGLEECQAAIEAGYDLVHFDGSGLPYEENIKVARLLVAEAHQRGALIEGEIDRILGKSSSCKENAETVQAGGNYTDPGKALDFVQKTGVDILAVFVGNLHGVYSQSPRLDLDRLKAIASQLPCFLSLHGGSGLAAEDLQKAAKIPSVVKVSFNTELRLAYRDTLENVLKGSDELAIYKIMTPVMAAVTKVVEEKIQLLGSAGKDAGAQGFRAAA